MDKFALRVHLFNLLISNQISAENLAEIDTLSDAEKEALLAFLFNGRLCFPLVLQYPVKTQFQVLLNIVRSCVQGKSFNLNALKNNQILLFDITYLQYQIKRVFVYDIQVQNILIDYLEFMKEKALKSLSEKELKCCQQNVLTCSGSTNPKVLYLMAELFAFFGWHDELDSAMQEFYEQKQSIISKQALAFLNNGIKKEKA